MRRSIRLRLQWWYGAVLGGSLLGFGILMYLSVRSSWLRELDNQIENGVQYLDVHLRRLPVWFLRGDPPPPPGERPPPGAGGSRGAQVSPRGLPRLLDELRLPLDPDPPPGAPPRIPFSLKSVVTMEASSNRVEFPPRFPTGFPRRNSISKPPWKPFLRFAWE